MLRLLLTPRWMAGTVLVAAVAVGFGWLAWWQWQRYEEVGGSWQNLAYAVQWPIFAGFGIYLWVRMLRETAVGPADEPDPEATEVTSLIETEQARRRSTALVLARDVELDEELVAYNAYLAGLHTRARHKLQSP